MNAVTIAGIISTVMFLGSNLPMVVQAIRSHDVSSYSRGYLVMTNVGNAVYTVYVLSLPAGPIWVLHLVYTTVSAFMLVVHVGWARAAALDAEEAEALFYPAYIVSTPTVSGEVGKRELVSLAG